MKLASGIHRHGFRTWYERELLRSHGCLALTFVCAIGLFAAFEAMSRFDNNSDRWIDLTAIVVCAVVGLWSLRRYLFLLMHAESVANQADCPGCGTYARFTLVSADAAGSDVVVRCRGCERVWTINA